jgi:acetyl esterase/lipase
LRTTLLLVGIKFKIDNMKKLGSVTGWLAFVSMFISPFFVQSVFAQQSLDTTKNVGSNKIWTPVQKSDYTTARKRFKTRLIKYGPSPQSQEETDSADVPPPGVTQFFFKSGNLTLKAWINKPNEKNIKNHPAIIFLHGGLAFGKGDWDMAKPFRDSGFIVITPMLRGENGQKGIFTFLYDEINDAIAAGAYARRQRYIDSNRIYLAGHSDGGTLALLAAMSCRYFKKAASFSALPDQVSYYSFGIDPKLIPFDTTDRREFQMRSPLEYANSFKCSARLYYGTEEPGFLSSSNQQTAEIAKNNGLDVKACEVEGGHMSAVEREMDLSIIFFNQH